jgi:hypothetical protein
MELKVTTVKSKSDLVKFIKSQWNFYQNDQYFIPPIIADRMKLLSKDKFPFFKHAEMEMFMVESAGKVVGRIAAIKNDNHNLIHEDKIGFFGFFECIDNQEVADLLFEHAANWLKSKGLTHARGPLNPSINDEIGTLIEGFDESPQILMTYNPRYYPTLIENAGFAKVKDLFAYKLHYRDFATDKMKRLQGLLREKYKVTVREVNFKNKKQFLEDIETLKGIYNKAWQMNWGAVKMTDEEFDFLAADLKPIAEQSLVYILDVKGVPAGFHIALPDLNQVFKYNRGGSMIGAIWHMLTKKRRINRVRIMVLGVLPEFQKLGLDAILYYESGERADKLKLNDAEASWILEDNEMMNKGLTTSMNGKVYKKYRVYEKAI